MGLPIRLGSQTLVINGDNAEPLDAVLTVPAGTELITIGLSTWEGSQTVDLDWTYDQGVADQAMTVMEQIDASDTTNSAVWQLYAAYLHNPTNVGTINLRVGYTFPSIFGHVLEVIYWDNVDATTPVGAIIKGFEEGASGAVSTPTVATDADTALGMFASGEPLSIAAAGQTELGNAASADGAEGAFGVLDAVATPNDAMDYNVTNGGWILFAVNGGPAGGNVDYVAPGVTGSFLITGFAANLTATVEITLPEPLADELEAVLGPVTGVTAMVTNDAMTSIIDTLTAQVISAGGGMTLVLPAASIVSGQFYRVMLSHADGSTGHYRVQA